MKTEWRVGDFVTAAGEGAAEVEQGRDGRSWGKLVLVGRVQKMETPEATTQTNEEGATPEPA